MRAVELLRELADHVGAGSVGKLAELAQMFVDDALRAGTLEWRPDEDRTIHGGRDDDRLTTDGGVL
jgi:hypothetical protein